MEPITELDALRWLKEHNGAVIFRPVHVTVSAHGEAVAGPTFLDTVINLKAAIGGK